MFPSVALIATTSLYLLSVVDAAPSKRQSDNGACAQLFNTCAGAVDKSLSNVFAIESCVFAATCFGGQRPVDNFLASLFSTKNGANGGVPPQSVGLPRVTSSVLNAISTDGKTISQQNFIDGFYGQLSVSNGPWPSSPDVVVNYYNRVAVWTAFCNGNIPFRNFQDYYQFSASVSSNGCGITSGLPPSTTTPTSPSTVPSSAPPATTTIVVSSDATCQKMFTTCVNEVNSAVDNIFSIKSCVLGATCFGGQRPVAGFVAAVSGQKNGAGTAPTPANEARVSTALFNAGSTDGGKTWTQQNFIDAWYSQLAAVGGPFPPNTDLVISYFKRVAVWTGFCGAIPYMNFADYFQFSATVSGPTTPC